MSELLLHFVVPFVALSYTKKLSFKEVFIASLIALTPDLDVFIHVHRYITHSIIIILAISIPIMLLVRKFKPSLNYLAYASLFGLATHVILDLFQGATPFLWPIIHQSMWIQVTGNVYISSNPLLRLHGGIKLNFEDCFEPFTFMDAPLFTSQGLIISIILLTPIFLFKLRDFVEKAQSRESS